jgi:hypothetical protein
MKKLLIAGALVLSSVGASAATLSAGGITWDDNTTGPGGIAMQANFQQWFTETATSTDNNGTADLTDDYQRVVSDTAVAGAFGKELVGLGEFYSFADGRAPAGPPSFCVTAGCELTFAFGGLVVNGLTGGGVPTFDISAAWFNVYIHQTPDFDGIGVTDTTLSSTAHTKFAEAQNGTLWGAFDFASFDLDGTILGGESEATLEIRTNAGLGLADVQSALDYNTALADLGFTAGATFLNSLYTNDGNGQFANAVPEPTSLAILGLGLLGLAGSTRRKKA